MATLLTGTTIGGNVALHAGNYGGYSSFTGAVTSGYGTFASPGYILGDAQYGLYVASGNLFYKSGSGGIHYWRNKANTANTLSIDDSGNVVAAGSIAGTTASFSGNVRVSTISAANHGLTCAYYGGGATTTNGYLITTNIDYSTFNMPTVIIEGYAYGNNQTINLQIIWYAYNNSWTNLSYTNLGSWNPGTVSIGTNAGGKVCLHLSGLVYYGRFNVRCIYDQGNAALEGWTVSDATTASLTRVLAVPKSELATSITGNAATVTSGLTTSNYTSYALPLTGGTLTGALNGTTAAFSGAITQGGNQVLHAGNYTSYPDATKLPLTGGTLTGQLNINHSAPASVLRLYSGGSTIWSLGVGDASGNYFNISADFGSFTISKTNGFIGIGTTSQEARIQLGSGTPTGVTEGIQFGSDTNARLYRTGTGVITCPGTIVATFSGSGASLTSLTAGNLSGTIPSGVLGNSTHYIGTTAITLNRASASQTLTGVSIDGSAATATARNINGTSFDHSANITTATWGTARTLTIGSTGKSVDGSAAVAWTLAEIGAVPVAGGTMTGVLTTYTPGVQTSVTGLSAYNAGVNVGERSVGSAAGFVPGYGQTTVYTGGYRSHMILGSYRTASLWGGGPFIAWGGNDLNATEYWLFNQGGAITHSGGKTMAYTDGTNASGSWGISVTGSSASCTGNATNVTGTVLVANGGTGATAAAGARTNLGATTLGANLFTLANVTTSDKFLRANFADNTVSALDAAAFRTAIGAGTGSGTVTSVTGTAPIASSGGATPAISLNDAGVTYAKIQNVSATARVLGRITALAGVVEELTGANIATIIGANAVTNATNATTAAACSGNAVNVTGTVLVANGGTGATAAAGARTNLGATTLGANLFTLANVAAISFIRVNANNTVDTLDAAAFRTAIGAGTSGGSGTVTSVGGTGTVSGLTLSGTVTTTGDLTLGGTLSVTPSNFASQTANTFLSAPNGAAGVPTFRAIVAADVPTLNQATTNNAGSVTYLPNRTDAPAYPVLWGAAYTNSVGTIAYSCAAVNIQSSTGTLSATSFSGAGTGLTGTAASLNIGGSAGSVAALGVKTGALDANIVTFAKMQQVTGPVAIGRVTATLGDMTTLSGADLATIIGSNTITNATNASTASALTTGNSYTITGLTSNSTVNIFPTYASGYSYFLRMGYDNSGSYDYTVKRNGTSGFLEFNGTQAGAIGYVFNSGDIYSSTTANSGAYYFNSTGHGLRRASGTNNVYLFTTSGNLYLGTGGSSSTEIIIAAGNLGVGTSPSYKLDVNGSCHATSFPTSSDVRFKKNIKPLKNCVDKVKKMQGVSYEWNEFVNNRRDGYALNIPVLGVIAQDLEKVIPEVVSKWHLSDDCKDARAVDYIRIIPVLIEAIKEQQIELDDLKNRLIRLENK